MNMCGAVYFASNANFYMSGGSITGNYCGTTTHGSAGLGFYLSMGDKNVHLSGSYTLSGNMQGTYDATTGTWSDLQPNDYLNTNRCHIRIDDSIDPTAPMVMVLYNNYYTDFTRGWSTFMEGKDPENYFTLLPHITDRGIGVVDGEATIGTLHNITLGDNITSTATSAAKGRPVTLGYTDTPEGYQAIYSVTIDGSNPAETVAVTRNEGGTYSFMMPDADVSVTAIVKPLFAIVLPSGIPHGTVTSDWATATEGETITLTVVPEASYNLYTLTVTTGDAPVDITAGENGTFTFVMPDADVTVSAVFGIAINEENFPDANFRNWLLSQRYGNDGALFDEEIAGITTMYIAYKSIANLKGIEYFTALKQLRCYSNQLTTIDVSHNTTLTSLDCSNNQLTALDVSHNTALTSLDCYKNQLDSLDISHNTALGMFRCSVNRLKEIDLSHNADLYYIDCYGNQLSAVDLSHNTALKTIICYNNLLTALDVSHNSALFYLECFGNQINSENMEVLVASLPTVDEDNDLGRNGTFRVVDFDSGTEQNVITTSQVATARSKNWTVFGRTNDYWEEYDGSTAYAISLPSSFEHGTVTCDKETAVEGQTVTLTVAPDNGYELETLTVTIVGDDEPSGAPKRLRGGSVELTPGDEPNTYTFEMPDAPVNVNATFVESTVTGIVDIDAAKPKTGKRYNLMGQPVGKDYRGIIIEDGQKIIVR